jgi:hypothetical protein
MKDITQTTNVYQTGTKTKPVEDASQLGGARFVCPARNTDKEVIAGLANVAAIERSRLDDSAYILKMLTQLVFDAFNLAKPTRSARTRYDGTASGYDRCVFDKR